MKHRKCFEKLFRFVTKTRDDRSSLFIARKLKHYSLLLCCLYCSSEESRDQSHGLSMLRTDSEGIDCHVRSLAAERLVLCETRIQRWTLFQLVVVR